MSNRVYISGKVTGTERDECVERFRTAETVLRNLGYRTVNPMRTLPGRWPWIYRTVGYTLTLLIDLWLLTRCSRIYKIPGWKESKGANIESCTAYHFGIYTLPAKEREDCDKRIARHMDKWQERRKR